MSEDLRSVARASETLLLELRDVRQNGPLIRIVHRFHKPGTGCMAGEEIWAVLLVFRKRESPLNLSLALRLLLDYLGRTRHIPQSATQIAAGLSRTEFYRKHGLNAGTVASRKFSRSVIKEYIKRIRQALSLALRETTVGLDSERVLVSRPTVGNEALYQLRARVEWVHVDETPSND